MDDNKILDFNDIARVIEVELEEEEETVWQCGCGSQLFYLHHEGEVSCAECAGFSNFPLDKTE